MYFWHGEELEFRIHFGTSKYQIYISFRARKNMSVSFGWGQILLWRLNKYSLEMPFSCQWLKSQTRQTANPRYLLDRNSSVSWIPPVRSSLFSFWQWRGLICTAPNLTEISISSECSVNLTIHFFWVQISFTRMLKKIKGYVLNHCAPAVFSTHYHLPNATAATW